MARSKAARLALALCLAGCAADEAMPSGVLDFDAAMHGDAAVTGDAAVQQDAALHSDAAIDAAVQQDAAAHMDASGQGDASGGLDADGVPDADAAQPAGPSGPLRVYVGGFGTQIGVFTIDLDTLQLTPAGTVMTAGGPSFLAFDAQSRFLVAADENADQVESFAIDAASGALSRIDGEPSGADGPARITLDRTGHWVLVAHFGGDKATVLPIADDGSLQPVVTNVDTGDQAHEVVLADGNDVAYVPCRDADRIALFDFDEGNGALSPRTPVNVDDGAGPRHFALSADGDIAWLLTEHTSTVIAYAVQADGALVEQATVSALPDDFNGGNTGAEIEVHPSGRFLYTSNRGHNSIAVFEIGAAGALTLIANTPTGGAQPRHFSLLPDGSALLVANQSSGTIHGFHIDADTGLLTSAGEIGTFASPAFVQAIHLP